MHHTILITNQQLKQAKERNVYEHDLVNVRTKPMNPGDRLTFKNCDNVLECIVTAVYTVNLVYSVVAFKVP